MGKILTGVGAFIIAVFIAGVVISLVAAWPLMLLWNWLLPVIFGFKVITFWQAFGLLFLTNIMFKSYHNTNNN